MATKKAANPRLKAAVRRAKPGKPKPSSAKAIKAAPLDARKRAEVFAAVDANPADKLTVVGAIQRAKVEKALAPLGVPVELTTHKSVPIPYWYEA